MDIEGQLELGYEDPAAPVAGSLRFNPETNDFEGWNGFFWASLSDYQFETGTITDCDGHTYKTIRIGDQIWMAENLKTTKYCDGNIIPELTNDSLWLNATSSAWCWYDNDSIGHKDFGRLYNWYALGEGNGICPDGWRIPNLSDWQILLNTLDSSKAGSQIRETGISHWTPPNKTATNSSGYTCLPGGGRYFEFYGIGEIATIWTIEDENPQYPTFLTFSRPNNFYWILSQDENNGASVRCLKE